MWLRYLLNICLGVLLMPQSHAQQGFCQDERRTDSAINHISRTYPYTSGQWQLACDSLLALCPELDQVWQMKAMPNIKLGNWAGCFAPLDRAVAINPKSWMPYRAFLKCIFTKDYETAIPELKASAAMLPGSGIMDHSFDFYIGLSYLCLDSLEQAHQYLLKDFAWQEQAKGKGDTHHVSLCYMGICLLQMDRLAEAEKIFTKCLGIYPQYPEPNFYLAELYRRTGKKVLAKAYYVKARQSILQGYTSTEDQEYYVNYPFEVTPAEVAEALKKLD